MTGLHSTFGTSDFRSRGHKYESQLGHIISVKIDHDFYGHSAQPGGVGWCKGVVYLVSPGRPTEIDLQLGKACYPCSR